ncbi:MAG: maleylacetoacetate isomerase [Maricaulaceae bacterium]|jgi:maleylacetoacetate isomerase
MKLYAYWASSASHRVRIALNLKGLDYEIVPVDLGAADGGAQHSAEYRALNPHGRVPTLVLDDGTALTQSLAIALYLDRAFPEPPFLPADSVDAAQALAFAQIIASDIQPLHVRKVLARLKSVGELDDAAARDWARHWICQGFDALEALAVGRKARSDFAFGDAPSLAEVTLIPQMCKARDFDVDFAAYPTLARIEEKALALKAFADAAPDRQPDAPRE